MWIVDELPEENRLLLLYDMFEGLKIGYYDATSQNFFNISGVVLGDVSAWMYIPNKPNTCKRVKDTVLQKNYVDAIKKK